MSPSASARLVVALASRNLRLHRVKTFIIGGIMFFGAFVFVTGTAILDSLERSMARSIVSSLAGHLQVFSRDAKDELALFGGLIMGVEDIGEIEDFAKVRDALVALPNVKAVVPMGIDQCSVTTGNELDRALEALRAAVRSGDAAARAALVERLRAIGANLQVELARKAEVHADPAELAKQEESVRRLQDDDFWAGLDRDPEQTLQFLDTRIAPLSEGGRMIYLRYVGTDLERFEANFDRFRVVEGQRVPPGERGILLNRRVYEEQFKHPVARELDVLHRAVTVEGRRIAGDPALEARARAAVSAYATVLYQLSPADAEAIDRELAGKLEGVSGGLRERLQAFLAVDDATIRDRHALFYALVAPRIRLFEVGIGDQMTLRTYTRGGSLNSANVRLHGTYEFAGLEQSDLAGGHNLLDLVTFRELYGHMSEAQRAELETIREEVAVEDVGRAEAEAALFGSADALVKDVAAATVADDVLAKLQQGGVRTATVASATFSREELEQGLALSAAVVLADDARLEESRAAIAAAVAPLGLQVVDWQAASGLIGQFIVVVRAVLVVALAVIFLVALVIINNAMVIAMQDRVAEIGTMRAIGAQRPFVMAVFLGESVVLGVGAGLLGALAGAGTVAALGAVGVPAVDDVTTFLFAGPRFHPSVHPGHVIVGLLAVVSVGLASTLYPARLATRVAPVVAMRGKGE